MAGSSNYIIGKFDASQNEVQGVHIDRFPTLAFFPKDHKKGYLYKGKRDS